MKTLVNLISKKSIYCQLSISVDQTLIRILDLRMTDLVIALDHHEAMEAVSKLTQWPRYRFLLEHISSLKNCFTSIQFEVESISCNFIVRDIAKSITRVGRFQSYLAWENRLGFMIGWVHRLDYFPLPEKHKTRTGPYIKNQKDILKSNNEVYN